jgi:hypothetical protein
MPKVNHIATSIKPGTGTFTAETNGKSAPPPNPTPTDKLVRLGLPTSIRIKQK